jgi:hypothetical protein
MNVPYDTGKVKIGVHYQPEPYVELDKDMLFLQECLLQKKEVFSFFRDIIKVLVE